LFDALWQWLPVVRLVALEVVVHGVSSRVQPLSQLLQQMQHLAAILHTVGCNNTEGGKLSAQSINQFVQG